MGIEVLSCFDGVGCGKAALDRAGVKIGRYVAYEIDKHAIAVAKTNHPSIEHRGSVIGADFTEFKGFDLVIGGFPCTDLSTSGKRAGLGGSKSSLFWELVRAIKEVRPKYFLVENNFGMPKDAYDTICKALGCEPILINSALVSAQNRNRYYWTNIPNIEQPLDKGITLDDILDTNIELNPAAIRGRRLNKAVILGRRLNDKGHRDDYNKNVPIIQCLEVRKTNTDKSNCLTTVRKDNVLTPLPIGRHPDAFGLKLPFRYYTLAECCRLQTLPIGYCDCIPESSAFVCLGNAWTVDVIAHIFRNLNLEG